MLTAPRRLGLLAAALLGAAALVVLHLQGAPGPRHPLTVPVLVLPLAMLVVELGRMHLDVRHSALTVSLSDVAVVVALFTVPPDQVVLLRALGCAPAVLWLYRRSRVKLAVNSGVLLLETSVSAALAALLVGSPDPGSPLSWAAVFLAVQVAGVVGGLAVDLAIVSSGERLGRADVAEGLLVGAAVSATSGLLGLVAVSVLDTSRAGGALVGLVYALGLVVYRAYARMRERKDALEAVHAFTRSLSGEKDLDALLRAVLQELPALLSCEHAAVVLLDDAAPGVASVVDLHDGHLRRTPAPALPAAARRVLGAGEALLVGRRARGAEDVRLLAEHGAGDLLAGPLAADGGAALGVLLATDRMGASRGFGTGDRILFETLSSHAGVALAHAGLVTALRHAADTDALTGLANRRGLTSALAALSGPAAVVVLDLDGDQVTAALGHAAGDALLRAAGARIVAGVRSGTVVARLDGDEFAVLLPGAGVEEATQVAERLLDLLAVVVDLEEVPVALEASAGIATSDRAADLVRSAEIALRTARARGGLLVYEPGMDPPSADRLAVAAELRRVLGDPALAGQVVPWFQPKARLADGTVTSVEALVRWQHPERGLVPPGAFIPVIESTGLVRPLTLHVLDRALAQAARWAAAGRPLVVAVNISARSLFDHELVDDVRGLLARHAVPASLLTLEITESAVMDDPSRAQAVLEDLAGLGLQLSVDDFGTGYSSLAYLARLPVSEVKVDRAFVSRMTSDPRDAAVVRSVVELGHSLGLRVVAEGVEEQDGWDALRALGCDVAQGYLLARPMPAADLDRWLSVRDAAASPLVATA